MEAPELFPMIEVIGLLSFTDGDCYYRHILIKFDQSNWTVYQNKIANYSVERKSPLCAEWWHGNGYLCK